MPQPSTALTSPTRPRAPAWMQRPDLEWLNRTVSGPRYLVTRCRVTTAHALWLALRHDVRGSGWRRRRSPEGGAER